jgi:hypothetical protein
MYLIYLMLAGEHSHILHECRESACGPPALWLGAPLKAAAGRATAVKLQTNGVSNYVEPDDLQSPRWNHLCG